MRRSRVRFSELPRRERVGILVLGAVQLGLLVAAELDIQRRPAPLIRGPKTRWRLLCLINFLGPLSYFTFGRLRGGRMAMNRWRRALAGGRPVSGRSRVIK
jgi:hypothetical protein